MLHLAGQQFKMIYTRQLWSSLFRTSSSLFFSLIVSDEVRRLKKAPITIDITTMKSEDRLVIMPPDIPRPEIRAAMAPLINPITNNLTGWRSCLSGEKAASANAVITDEKKMIGPSISLGCSAILFHAVNSYVSLLASTHFRSNFAGYMEIRLTVELIEKTLRFKHTDIMKIPELDRIARFF